MKHLLKVHNPTKLDQKCRRDQFSSQSLWLHLNHFKVGNEKQFWMPKLSELRNEDVQWAINDLVVSDTVIRSRDLPFLVLAGLRGTRPYALGRVSGSWVVKVIPQTGHMRKFTIYHKNGKASFAKMMI